MNRTDGAPTFSLSDLKDDIRDSLAELLDGNTEPHKVRDADEVIDALIEQELITYVGNGFYEWSAEWDNKHERAQAYWDCVTADR